MGVSRRARHHFAVQNLQWNDRFGIRILSHYEGPLGSFKLLNQENKGVKDKTFSYFLGLFVALALA